MRCFSVQGGYLHLGRNEAVLCAWSHTGTFAHSFPIAHGKLKGCQPAPGDLTDANPLLKLEHFLLPALLQVSQFEQSNNT